MSGVTLRRAGGSIYGIFKLMSERGDFLGTNLLITVKTCNILTSRFGTVCFFSNGRRGKTNVVVGIYREFLGARLFTARADSLLNSLVLTGRGLENLTVGPVVSELNDNVGIVILSFVVGVVMSRITRSFAGCLNNLGSRPSCSDNEVAVNDCARYCLAVEVRKVPALEFMLIPNGGLEIRNGRTVLCKNRRGRISG